MKIAVEGCAHGELDKIYEVLKHLENENDMKVDLLIICGDFQSVRNNKDLACMAVSEKYRKLNTFYKYHSGEMVAPVLTIFVGGNHEASNYLSELFYGGWVCPNIYYLGRAGVIQVNGIRIAGLSGIYKGNDYLKGHFEHYPFTESTKRSIYHVRSLEVFRLKQLKEPIDVIISHDWPRGVYNYGDKEGLLRRKDFFRQEVESNTLGSRPGEDLLKELKPAYWFAAHLHCKFAAIIPHSSDTESGQEKKYTRFLALDKCLPRRRFLQVVDIGPSLTQGEKPVLRHDPEWLAVLRSTNHLLNLTPQTQFMPGPGSKERFDFTATESEKEEAVELLDSLVISPSFFERTAPSHTGDTDENKGPFPLINPQTSRLSKALGLTDPYAKLKPPTSSGNSRQDLAENVLSDDDALSENDDTGCSSFNADEIELDTEEKDQEEPGVEGLFMFDRSGSSGKKKAVKNTPPKRMERSQLVLSSPKNVSTSMLNFDVTNSGGLEIGGFEDLEIISSGGMNCPREESESISKESSFLSNNLSEVGLTFDNESSDLEVAKKRCSAGELDCESSPSPKRTMKRRNQDLYCSKDDDE